MCTRMITKRTMSSDNDEDPDQEKHGPASSTGPPLKRAVTTRAESKFSAKRLPADRTVCFHCAVSTERQITDGGLIALDDKCMRCVVAAQAKWALLGQGKDTDGRARSDTSVKAAAVQYIKVNHDALLRKFIPIGVDSQFRFGMRASMVYRGFSEPEFHAEFEAQVESPTVSPPTERRNVDAANLGAGYRSQVSART